MTAVIFSVNRSQIEVFLSDEFQKAVDVERVPGGDVIIGIKVFIVVIHPGKVASKWDKVLIRRLADSMVLLASTARKLNLPEKALVYCEANMLKTADVAVEGRVMTHSSSIVDIEAILQELQNLTTSKEENDENNEDM